MSKIFCIIGKSASGKDTLYKKIIANKDENLVSVVPYTTRPKRVNEENGVDYYFVSESDMKTFENENRIIEKRKYLTVKGIWYYFTCDFEMQDDKNYILITTLEGLSGIIKRYGEDNVCIVYLYLDDKERLLRCIERESMQVKPDYTEVCRRFIADNSDFPDEVISNMKNVNYIDTSHSPDECLSEWKKLYESLK